MKLRRPTRTVAKHMTAIKKIRKQIENQLEFKNGTKCKTCRQKKVRRINYENMVWDWLMVQ